MKPFTILIAIILSNSYINLHAQDLTLKSLFTLQSQKFEQVNYSLSEKGWNLHDAELQEQTLSFGDQKKISWTLNKNSYNNKAQGWFYLVVYEKGFDNAIELQTTMTSFNAIKKEATNQLKLSESTIVDNKIQTTFVAGPVKIVFTIQTEPKGSYRSSTTYNIIIYNYKDVKKRTDRLEAIHLLDDQYNTQISLADSYLERKNYKFAKVHYENAIKISSSRDYPHAQIRTINRIIKNDALEREYLDLIEKADLALSNKNYTDALNYYRSASKKKWSNAYPKEKIKEINKIQTFLAERRVTTYDLKDIDYMEYKDFEQDLVVSIQNEFREKNITFKTVVALTFYVDTLGRTSSKSSTISSTDDGLTDRVLSIAMNKSLKQTYKHGYTVNGFTAIKISLSLENNTISVKKNNVETTIKGDNQAYSKGINNLIEFKPIGKYKLAFQRNELNGLAFSDSRIVEYKQIGGPKNAFLSILVPGLGVSNVTGGNKNGLKMALWTYGLIATGAGLKFISNSEYDLYHNATDQTEMDLHFESAELYNQSAYVFVGAGIVLWAYDVLWVTTKGFQNRKDSKPLRKQLSFNYNPINKGLCFNYSINF